MFRRTKVSLFSVHYHPYFFNTETFKQMLFYVHLTVLYKVFCINKKFNMATLSPNIHSTTKINLPESCLIYL